MNREQLRTFFLAIPWFEVKGEAAIREMIRQRIPAVWLGRRLSVRSRLLFKGETLDQLFNIRPSTFPELLDFLFNWTVIDHLTSSTYTAWVLVSIAEKDFLLTSGLGGDVMGHLVIKPDRHRNRPEELRALALSVYHDRSIV